MWKVSVPCPASSASERRVNTVPHDAQRGDLTIAGSCAASPAGAVGEKKIEMIMPKVVGKVAAVIRGPDVGERALPHS